MKFDSRNNCNAIIERYINRLVIGCQTTIIPHSVTRIGGNAFDGCSNLKKLDIPNSVTSIDGAAFWGCKNLTLFIAGENVESIGEAAFYGCDALESIILPQSLESIGSNAFTDCISLHDVYCYAVIPPSTYPSYSFENAPVETATLHVPASAIETYRQTAPWNTFANIVALNDDDPKPTGILNKIMMSNSYPEYYYTIDGIKSSKPHRGINIIRMNDGTIKKSYVK